MILVLLGALVIGLSLGLLGSGGSILTVPLLVFLLGQDEKIAIAGSLIIVGSIALFGALPHVYKKLIDWQSVLYFGIPSMFGAYSGAFFSQYLNGATQLTLFAFIMLGASFKMITSKASIDGHSENKAPYKAVLSGLGVGIVTGLVGVGGGFLIVPALVLLIGLSMQRAVATSLLIIALNSFVGFYKYHDLLAAQNLFLDWKIIFWISGIGILGSFVGQAVSKRIPQQKLKQIFGLFLVLMAIFIIVKTVPQLLH